MLVLFCCRQQCPSGKELMLVRARAVEGRMRNEAAPGVVAVDPMDIDVVAAITKIMIILM